MMRSEQPSLAHRWVNGIGWVDVRALHEKASGRCAICRGSLEFSDVNLDHVFPTSSRPILGSVLVDSITNLQVVHRGCNSRRCFGKNFAEQMPLSVIQSDGKEA